MTYTEWKMTLAVLADDYHSGQWSTGYKLSCYIGFTYTEGCAEEIRQTIEYQQAADKFKSRL